MRRANSKLASMQTDVTKPLRIFLVEDSPAVLERLSELLGAIPATRIIGCATGADEAIRAILAAKPDVVVLDMQLAQGSGFDVLRAVHAQAPAIDIYLLSNYASPSYREAALRLGARDFFDKTADFNRVRDIVAARVHATAH